MNVEELSIAGLMRKYRVWEKIYRGNHAWGVGDSEPALKKKKILNELEGRGVELDIEPCLSCEYPALPEHEVENNACPHCRGVFDIPEDLPKDIEMEDKTTILRKRKKRRDRHFGWLYDKEGTGVADGR